MALPPSPLELYRTDRCERLSGEKIESGVRVEGVVSAGEILRIIYVFEIELRGDFVSFDLGGVARESIQPRPARQDECVFEIAPRSRRGGHAGAHSQPETILSEIIGEKNFSRISRRIDQVIPKIAGWLNKAVWVGVVFRRVINHFCVDQRVIGDYRTALADAARNVEFNAPTPLQASWFLRKEVRR